MLLSMMLLLARVTSGHQQSAIDSACSEYTIPFSFRTDENGNPTLSCTSLICFGEKRLYELKRDDIISEMEAETKSLLGSHSYTHKSLCDKNYQNRSCTGSVQWIVGLLLEDDGNSVKAKWKCCNYQGLRYGRAIKTAIIRPNESYTGGEVNLNGQTVAFDLIKEINLLFDEQHRPLFELLMARLPCSSKLRNANESKHDRKENLLKNPLRKKEAKPRRRSTIRKHRHFHFSYLPRQELIRRRMPSLLKKTNRLIPRDYEYYDREQRIRISQSDYQRSIEEVNKAKMGSGGSSAAAAAVSRTPHESTSPDEDEIDYLEFVDSDSSDIPRSQPLAIGKVGQLVPTYSYLQYLPQGTPMLKAISAVQNVPTYIDNDAPLYNGYFETLQCFSRDTTVQTPGQVKRIDELRVGDQVLSVEQSLVSYSPVVMFLHRSNDELTVFNKIILANNEMIKLTDYHLLYVTDCTIGENLRLMFAKDVRLGHCLHVVQKHSNELEPVQVSDIQRLTTKGFYAPLTANGDIIVNSILSSCHSNLAVQTLQQSVFKLLRKLQHLISTDESSDGLLPGVQFLTEISDLFLPHSTT